MSRSIGNEHYDDQVYMSGQESESRDSSPARDYTGSRNGFRGETYPRRTYEQPGYRGQPRFDDKEYSPQSSYEQYPRRMARQEQSDYQQDSRPRMTEREHSPQYRNSAQPNLRNVNRNRPGYQQSDYRGQRRSDFDDSRGSYEPGQRRSGFDSRGSDDMRRSFSDQQDRVRNSMRRVSSERDEFDGQYRSLRDSPREMGQQMRGSRDEAMRGTHELAQHQMRSAQELSGRQFDRLSGMARSQPGGQYASNFTDMGRDFGQGFVSALVDRKAAAGSAMSPKSHSPAVGSVPVVRK